MVRLGLEDLKYFLNISASVVSAGGEDVCSNGFSLNSPFFRNVVEQTPTILDVMLNFVQLRLDTMIFEAKYNGLTKQQFIEQLLTGIDMKDVREGLEKFSNLFLSLLGLPEDELFTRILNSIITLYENRQNKLVESLNNY